MEYSAHYNHTLGILTINGKMTRSQWRAIKNMVDRAILEDESMEISVSDWDQSWEAATKAIKEFGKTWKSLTEK